MQQTQANKLKTKVKISHKHTNYPMYIPIVVNCTTNRKKLESQLTVKQAVEEYIISKEGVLSPATIRGYVIIKNNALSEIENFQITNISEKQLQLWVSNNSKKYAPKSVKNQFSLVTAALKQNKIDLDFSSVLLPKSQVNEPIIPNEKQTALILHIIEGTNIEIPVTMAVTLGLRQSEIAGLRWSDYDGKTISIHGAKVPNKQNKYVYKKTTKSSASTRVLEVDALLKSRLDRADQSSEFISPMLPSSVLRKFNKLCKQHNLPQFTMHAQRHGNASMMLAKNIPDKYAMKRLGQSSNSMLKKIYQHLYDSKEKQVSLTVSNTFQSIYQDQCKIE